MASRAGNEWFVCLLKFKPATHASNIELHAGATRKPAGPPAACDIAHRKAAWVARRGVHTCAPPRPSLHSKPEAEEARLLISAASQLSCHSASPPSSRATAAPWGFAKLNMFDHRWSRALAWAGACWDP